MRDGVWYQTKSLGVAWHLRKHDDFLYVYRCNKGHSAITLAAFYPADGMYFYAIKPINDKVLIAYLDLEASALSHK